MQRYCPRRLERCIICSSIKDALTLITPLSNSDSIHLLYLASISHYPVTTLKIFKSNPIQSNPATSISSHHSIQANYIPTSFISQCKLALIVPVGHHMLTHFPARNNHQDNVRVRENHLRLRMLNYWGQSLYMPKLSKLHQTLQPYR